MITSYLNLLERRYADRLDPDGRDFVRYAVDGAQRMRGLLDDLLHVLRAGTASADFRLVSSAHLFENAVSNLRAAIADATAIVTASPLPEITADAYLLTQVFQNLISNAIKFHAPGVRPQVHVWAEQRAGDSVTSGWVVAVRDNGIGIEPQHSARIFQAFERLHTPEEYPGSGVGLAIAQRIVERHGGTIWVDSQPGLGSTFYFSLPSAHAPCPIPDSAAAASAGR